MGRITIEELHSRRLTAMTDAERAEFDEALAFAQLAIEVGEKVSETVRRTESRSARGPWETRGYGSD